MYWHRLPSRYPHRRPGVPAPARRRRTHAWEPPPPSPGRCRARRRGACKSLRTGRPSCGTAPWPHARCQGGRGRGRLLTPPTRGGASLSGVHGARQAPLGRGHRLASSPPPMSTSRLRHVGLLPRRRRPSITSWATSARPGRTTATRLAALGTPSTGLWRFDPGRPAILQTLPASRRRTSTAWRLAPHPRAGGR